MNPATGWAIAALSGHPGGSMPTLRALLPIAVGHVASVIIAAAAVPAALQLGQTFDPLLLQGVAAGLLLVLAMRHVRGGRHRGAARPPDGQAVLGLWSFIAGTAHGAGWMLVPALVPVCGGFMPAREITASGSLLLALAAVGVHMAAMLATTAAMAAGARCGLIAACRWLKSRRCNAIPIPR
jgi:hypothetical protein